MNTYWFGSCHLAEFVMCSFRRIVTPKLEWFVKGRGGSGHLFMKQHWSFREVLIGSDRHHRIGVFSHRQIGSRHRIGSPSLPPIRSGSDDFLQFFQ